jgi:hypothetical protein
MRAVGAGALTPRKAMKSTSDCKQNQRNLAEARKRNWGLETRASPGSWASTLIERRYSATVTGVDSFASPQIIHSGRSGGSRD